MNKYYLLEKYKLIDVSACLTVSVVNNTLVYRPNKYVPTREATILKTFNSPVNLADMVIRGEVPGFINVKRGSNQVLASSLIYSKYGTGNMLNEIWIRVDPQTYKLVWSGKDGVL